MEEPPSESTALTTALQNAVFHAAGGYHAALARYAGALLRGGEALESAVQQVIISSLRYRAALDELARHADSPESRRRRECLATLLAGARRQYGIRKRA